MAHHNKFGLMGWNGVAPGVIGDRSQVLPFSVMMFDDDEGWQQYGVYENGEAAQKAVDEVVARYGGRASVADTNAILDLADLSDEPLWHLPEGD